MSRSLVYPKLPLAELQQNKALRYMLENVLVVFEKNIQEIISYDKLVSSNNYQLPPPGRVKFVTPKVLSPSV